VEPAAVLVGALEVQVRGPPQALAQTQHRLVARSRVEPDVEDVALAVELAAAACGAGEARGQELLDRALVPGVRPVLREHVRRLLREGGREDGLAAFHAVHGGDRHAPRPLARDAPVGPVGQHGVDPVLAPRRHPLHAMDRVESPRPQVSRVHGDEPLRRGKEDHRVVAAPAVRVRVGERLAVPESAAGRQRLLDPRVGVEHALAREDLDLVQEVAAGPDRRVDVQAVLHAGIEVVRAVTGRRVHRAGALFERHVVREDADRVTPVEGVLKADPFEQISLEPRDRIPEGPVHALPNLARQLLRHDHRRLADLVRPVGELRVEGDRQVRGDRPGRRGPDQDRDPPPGELGDPSAQLGCSFRGKRKLHVDGWGAVVLVLDFGLGESRPAVDAPVDRLLPLVDHALFDEPGQRAHDRRLVPVAHGEVGLGPLAHDPQPLEVGALHVHEAGGEVAAGPPEIADGHLALLRAQLAVHPQLDREAVAIPPGHVRRVEACHGAGAHHEVLEHLVERRAEVDPAIGVRRAIVQDEGRRTRAAAADLRVEAVAFPSGKRVGLGGLEVRLHREPGPRQVERLLPIGHMQDSGFERPGQARIHSL